ncbi:hypothetical protein PCANC_26733, partial [Puccinia coronata f. sp. avenae]
MNPAPERVASPKDAKLASDIAIICPRYAKLHPLDEDTQILVIARLLCESSLDQIKTINNSVASIRASTANIARSFAWYQANQRRSTSQPVTHADAKTTVHSNQLPGPWHCACPATPVEYVRCGTLDTPPHQDQRSYPITPYPIPRIPQSTPGSSSQPRSLPNPLPTPFPSSPNPPPPPPPSHSTSHSSSLSLASSPPPPPSPSSDCPDLSLSRSQSSSIIMANRRTEIEEAKLQLEESKIISQAINAATSKIREDCLLAADGSNFAQWTQDLQELGQTYLNSTDFFERTNHNSVLKKIGRAIFLASLHPSLVYNGQGVLTCSGL